MVPGRKNLQVALVGRSGVGKSTFFRLISRAYQPTTGKIWVVRSAAGRAGCSAQQVEVVMQQYTAIYNLPSHDDVSVLPAHPQDGVPLNECHVASLVAVVEQETALFQGTALENLHMADPSATEEQARELRAPPAAAAALVTCYLSGKVMSACEGTFRSKTGRCPVPSAGLNPWVPRLICPVIVLARTFPVPESASKAGNNPSTEGEIITMVISCSFCFPTRHLTRTGSSSPPTGPGSREEGWYQF